MLSSRSRRRRPYTRENVVNSSVSSFAQIQAFSQSYIWNNFNDKYYNMLWNSNKIAKIDIKKCWHFHGISWYRWLFRKNGGQIRYQRTRKPLEVDFWKIEIFWKKVYTYDSNTFLYPLNYIRRKFLRYWAFWGSFFNCGLVHEFWAWF